MTFAYHICYSALDECQNLEESYGEICVLCNKCGRWTKKEQDEDEEQEDNR